MLFRSARLLGIEMVAARLATENFAILGDPKAFSNRFVRFHNFLEIAVYTRGQLLLSCLRALNNDRKAFGALFRSTRDPILLRDERKDAIKAFLLEIHFRVL